MLYVYYTCEALCTCNQEQLPRIDLFQLKSILSSIQPTTS